MLLVFLNLQKNKQNIRWDCRNNKHKKHTQTITLLVKIAFCGGFVSPPQSANNRCAQRLVALRRHTTPFRQRDIVDTSGTATFHRSGAGVRT